jgi:hypothetical protein
MLCAREMTRMGWAKLGHAGAGEPRTIPPNHRMVCDRLAAVIPPNYSAVGNKRNFFLAGGCIAIDETNATSEFDTIGDIRAASVTPSLYTP